MSVKMMKQKGVSQDYKWHKESFFSSLVIMTKICYYQTAVWLFVFNQQTGLAGEVWTGVHTTQLALHGTHSARPSFIQV